MPDGMRPAYECSVLGWPPGAFLRGRVRVVPSIVDYAARHGRGPAPLACGFAALLCCMRGGAADRGGAAGECVPGRRPGRIQRDGITAALDAHLTR
ncbi:MAG TPA: hypothetical protein VG432_09910 [Gemmatimonadaceae bacterium]|nr:hypothetical protein [Gemmatimonadaceae bacterium]